MGNVFNSMPKWEKSCSALLPAVAPNAVQATFQPNLYRVLNLEERKYLTHLQVRQRLTPQLDCAFSNKACSVCGIIRGISSIISV